jgi:cytosine/adenosine deaminase-related metal-dependent hydrolase
MAIFRARWILPIDSPSIHGGWIETAERRVVGVGRGTPPAAAQDLGHVVVLPALVNAHTHLELSWLAGHVPPAASMIEWIRAILRLRADPPGGETERLAAMRRGVAEMWETGTSVVGDVSNTMTSAPVLHDAGLGGVVFHEILGFDVSPAAATAAVRQAWSLVDDTRAGLDVSRNPGTAGPLNPGTLGPWDPGTLAFSVVAHAPYSCSPGLITELANRRRTAPLAVHIAESPEEIEFLRTGRGPFRDLLEEVGVWDEEWPVPECDPITYLDRQGYLQPGLLAVHGVHLRDADLERLRDAGGVIVTCPRSNEWVGVGLPPLARAYATGVPVAVGTDSLASVGSLNLFDELAAMRRIAPEVTAAKFLESATRIGAAALGLEAELGTIAPGRRADLLVVDVPAGLTDVEEYLVSGVPASAVTRLHV